MLEKEKITKVGVAGCGALGSIVIDALTQGIDGYYLHAISDIAYNNNTLPNLSFDQLAEQCDLIIECLPPAAAADLARKVLSRDKNMIMISACAMLLHPEIYELSQKSSGKIIIPSGALAGLDAVNALNTTKIDSALIASTKPPNGFIGAPYIAQNNIDLDNITEKTCLFRGNALDAAVAFPKNVNVAATLSIAAIGPEHTQVEVWCDPNTLCNSHEITVSGGNSTITSRVDNRPDPSNPKSSALAGHSIVLSLIHI